MNKKINKFFIVALLLGLVQLLYNLIIVEGVSFSTLLISGFEGISIFIIVALLFNITFKKDMFENQLIFSLILAGFYSILTIINISAFSVSVLITFGVKFLTTFVILKFFENK